MRLILTFLLIIISNISYGSDRTTDIYLSLSKQTNNSWLPSNIDVVFKKSEEDISEIISNSPSIIIRKNTENLGLSLPSIRGFSSNQTTIVYDGIKLPKDVTSTYDLSILPNIGIDKLYILKGGWSSVFGANAEGGVVAIDAIKPKNTEIEFGSGFSSFNGERYYFKNTIVKDKISSIIWTENYQSDGFQQNSYALKNSLYGRFSYGVNKGSINLNFFAVKLKRGLPSGTPVDIKLFNGERERQSNSLTDWQEDRNLFASIRYSFNSDFISGNLSYSRSDLLRNAYQFGSLTRINTYANNILSYFKTSIVNFGFEVEENILRSKDYGDHRMKGIGYFINKNFDIFDSASVGLYARYDDSKDFNNVFSPKLILNYGLIDGLILTYSVGSSWRAPNFADVYGAPVYWYDPNPNIKPEKSLSNEISFSFSGRLKTQLSFYYYDIDDKITIYTDPNTWKSKSVNLSKGYTKGVEIVCSYNIFGLNLDAGINFIDVRGKNKNEGKYKKMAYSPDKKLITNISYNRNNIDIGFKNIYVSKQWSSQNKTGKFIPSYSVSSFYFSRLIDNIRLRFGINNVFNERYATTADAFNGYYPSDPRTYFLDFSFTF